MPSPALSKFVEIEGSTIRVAYLDFVDCSKYSMGLPTDIRSRTEERCLEYVTYSFVWDKTLRQFRELYKPSRRTAQATVSQPIAMKTMPAVSAVSHQQILPDDRVQVIKHYEKMKQENGKKSIETWFYVKHPSGVLGYVPANKIVFKNTEHAVLLKSFYEKTPLMKQDWHTTNHFVVIRN